MGPKSPPLGRCYTRTGGEGSIALFLAIVVCVLSEIMGRICIYLSPILANKFQVKRSNNMAYLVYFYDKKEKRSFFMRYLYYTQKEIRSKARVEFPNCRITSIERMNGWL